MWGMPRYVWVCVDGCAQMFAGVHRCMLVCTGVCRCAQVCMGVLCYMWVHFGVRGFLWVCAGLCGYVQVYAGVCAGVCRRNFQNTFWSSVRGMQYILNMAVNAKISEGLVHKVSFECFRIWPLVLWPLWEDFEKLAFAEEYL